MAHPSSTEDEMEVGGNQVDTSVEQWDYECEVCKKPFTGKAYLVMGLCPDCRAIANKAMQEEI